MINQQALNAIRSAELTGANIAMLFEQIACEAERVGSAGGLFVLSYLNPDSPPAEGELVPTITFALKPFITK